MTGQDVGRGRRLGRAGGVRVKSEHPRDRPGGGGEGTFLGRRRGTMITHTPGLPPKGGRRIMWTHF